MSYVDGFVIPVKKENIEAYRLLAEKGARIWMKHGALDTGLKQHDVTGNKLRALNIDTFAVTNPVRAGGKHVTDARVRKMSCKPVISKQP